MSSVIHHPQAIDWSNLLHELRFAHAMTMLDIAMQAGVSRESIRTYYASIARPKHREGELLVELWISVTHKPREQLPKMPVVLSAASFREM